MTGFSLRRRELLLQREMLRLRSTELRLDMAAQSAVLQRPLALADQVRGGLHWLRQHPEWPLGGLLLLAVLRPRRMLRWGGSLWGVWRLWQRGQRALRTWSALRA